MISSIPFSDIYLCLLILDAVRFGLWVSVLIKGG